MSTAMTLSDQSVEDVRVHDLLANHAGWRAAGEVAADWSHKPGSLVGDCDPRRNPTHHLDILEAELDAELELACVGRRGLNPSE